MEIVRENGQLVVRVGREYKDIEKAVRDFVATEIAGTNAWLSPDMIKEAQLAKKCLSWHPRYDRLAWPDTDPPLDIVEIWQPYPNHFMVFYKCQRVDCIRCHNPKAEWSSHFKAIRSDGLDNIGAGVEVEVRRGKRRETEVVLVDQPVFVLAEDVLTRS